MRRSAYVTALALLFASCNPLGIDQTEVEGVWLMSARNLTAPGTTCHLEHMELQIRQDGDRFSGVAQAGSLFCVHADSLTTSVSVPTEPIVGGRIIGDVIRFQIGNADWSHDGLIDDESMTGELRLRYGPPVGTAQLSGRFAAARVDTLQQRPAIARAFSR